MHQTTLYPVHQMRRYFRFAFTLIAMLATMLVSTLLTLRIMLHVGETVVPSFAGLTVSEASDAALKAGLGLNIENRFYSTTVPPGRILSQAPAVGSRVRQGWQVRVTESLGPQQVTIPDVSGQVLREASMNLRRNGLDLGTLAHMDAPGDPDIVLAQTPPPDAGVDQPRVSLLLSSASGGASTAIVLPSFAGMSWHDASRAAAALGLRTAYLGQSTSTAESTPPNPAATGTLNNGLAAPTPAVVPQVSFGPSGPVLSQSPDSGHRANRGDTIKLTFAHVTLPAAPPAGPIAPSTTPVPAPPTPAPPASQGHGR